MFSSESTDYDSKLISPTESGRFSKLAKVLPDSILDPQLQPDPAAIEENCLTFTKGIQRTHSFHKTLLFRKSHRDRLYSNLTNSRCRSPWSATYLRSSRICLWHNICNLRRIRRNMVPAKPDPLFASDQED